MQISDQEKYIQLGKLIQNKPHIFHSALKPNIIKSVLKLLDLDIEAYERIPEDEFFKPYDENVILPKNKINILYPSLNKYASFNMSINYITYSKALKIDEYEWLDSDEPHKIVIETNENVSLDNVQKLQNEFIKFINDEFGDFEIFTRISFNSNMKTYEILFTNCYVNNIDDKINIFTKFMNRLPRNIKKFFSSTNFENPENGKITRLTFLSPSKHSTYKDIVAKHPKAQIVPHPWKEDVDNEFIKVSDTNKNKLINLTVINVNGNNNNIIVGNNNIQNNNQKNIQNNNNLNNFDNFINHILQNQPDWYKQELWIPKRKIAEEYNKLYTKESTTMIIKKMHNRIFNESGWRKINGRTARCVKLKKIEDIV